MLDFINAYTFMDIAHHMINLWERSPWNNNILKKNCIIFCHPDNLDILFFNMQFSSNKYILVTSGSDWPIDKTRFLKKPACIKKWFAINAVYEHSDLIPIPYGLGPHRGDAKWAPVDGLPYSVWFAENYKKFTDVDKDINILYCNYTVSNNQHQRKGILNKLKNNNISYYWGGNAPEENVGHYTPYKYFEDMSKFKFVISPPGNGVDCHRTWEALYMNNIPIVLKNRIYDEFKDLPIIQVNDYNEISYDLLHSYLGKTYNYEKIYMEYWKNRILLAFNSL
jgi:hypothetical protein